MLAGPVNLREESIAQAVQPLSWPRPRLPSAIVWGEFDSWLHSLDDPPSAYAVDCRPGAIPSSGRIGS
jgi:hypothetical protein